MRKQDLKLVAYLAMVVVIGLANWRVGDNVSHVALSSRDGTWDLRAVDYASSVARLSGSVAYVPRALLTPQEFDAFERSGRVAVGAIPDRTEYLTSRIRLLLPDDGFYEIAGFADDMGSRIFVNGERVVDTGLPAATKAENVAAERFLSFTVRPQNGVVEIVQQSSNFVFRTNTSHIRWTVGRPEVVNRWVSGFTYSYVVNMGIYLALFFVHLLLFLIIPSYRPNLYFALLCLVWALRTGITSVRPLSVLLPWLSWTISFRIEYLTVLAALVLITLAYNWIFPGILPRAPRVFVYVSQSLLAAFYLFADPLAMSRTMILYEVIAGSWAALALVCLARRLRHPDAKQKIIFAGLFLILVSLVLDALYYNKIYLPFIHNVVTETSVVIFSLFQMTAMFLGTMEEVAAAKAAEERLAMENAAHDRVSRLKSDMMATLSHELRTPLAVMMGYAQIASAELKDRGIDAQTSADLRAIVAETRRLANLVEEMRHMSLVRTGDRNETVSVETVIRQIARLYAPIMERRHTALRLEIAPDLPRASIGADELTQVLFNLLNNADRHTKNGTITAGAALEGEQGDRIVLSVSDTGTGIEAEQLPHVFERYWTGGAGEGSGIGLAVCREIVEGRGGEIAIESEPGKGTVVRFTIPVARAEGGGGDG